jgi:hypothetical protein
VLAATAALPVAALPLLAGCKGVGLLATPPKPGGEVARLRAAISAEELMVGRYEAVLSAVSAGRPALMPVLRPLLAQHREHLAQLRSRLVVPAGSAAAAAATPRPRVASPPAAPRLAVGYLQAAEQDAAARLMGQLLAVSPALAQLLASIAAAEATHVPVLAAARRSG